jgi:hypothetical protein
MATLTHMEATVLDIVRRQAELGDPVPTYVIKNAAWRYRVSYDGTDRALRGLMKKNLVTKPSRGFYLPAHD